MITVQKRDIAPILKNAVRVANEKSTIKIFAHFAIKVENGVMTVTASDGARSFSESCDVIGDDVRFTVNADKLTRTINTFKSGDITIALENPMAVISHGRSTINIDSLNYDDFPIVPEDECKDTGLNSIDMFTSISKISHAMAQKDVRPYLNGVHLSNGVIVATDGHRMAYDNVSYKGLDIIIPADSVSKMPQIEGNVLVSDGQLIIRGERSSFTTNLIDANYPNWRRVIPSTIEITAVFDKEMMINAISQALISDENGTLEFSDSEIVIKNKGAESVIPAQCTGNGSSAFRLQYLGDSLKACHEGAVTLQSGGDVRPSIINDKYVVMPVRI